MRFDELLQIAINDICNRNLASPSTRLNGLKSVACLIVKFLPGIESDVVQLRRWPKKRLVPILENLKGKPLNGAESSALSTLLSHIPCSHSSQSTSFSILQNPIITGNAGTSRILNKDHKLSGIAKMLAKHIEDKTRLKATYYFEVTPLWLSTTLGPEILGPLWQAACNAYETISGHDKSLKQILLDCPISLKRQSFDLYFEHPIDIYIEFDESQHFNQFRASTLETYPLSRSNLKWRFDTEGYLQYCNTQFAKPGKSGFQRLKSVDPLFPPVNDGEDQDNRHRQRAFRDMLKDFLAVLNSNGLVRIPYYVISKKISGFDREDLKTIIKYIEEKGLLSDLGSNLC